MNPSNVMRYLLVPLLLHSAVGLSQTVKYRINPFPAKKVTKFKIKRGYAPVNPPVERRLISANEARIKHRAEKKRKKIAKKKKEESAPGNVNELKLWGIEFGFGLPQLIMGEFSIHMFPRFQFGAGFGFLPGTARITPQLGLPDIPVTLADGNEYKLVPSSSSTLDAFSPFIRWYPTYRKFYLQLTYAILRTHNTVTMQVRDNTGTIIEGASVNGLVDLNQSMPSISIGHIFSTNIFFVNLNLGFSFIGTISGSVGTLSGTLPDGTGEVTDNTQVFDGVKDELLTSANAASEQYRREVLALPFFAFTFGFMF